MPVRLKNLSLNKNAHGNMFTHTTKIELEKPCLRTGADLENEKKAASNMINFLFHLKQDV